jgi:hypothetical protein
MRAFWIAGAMLITCGALADSAPQTPQSETPASRDARSNDQRQPATHPTPATDVSLSRNPQVTDKHTGTSGTSEPKHWWENTALTNFLIAIFAGCSVVVGGLQAFVYWKQKGVMQAALETSEKATKATEKAANAAELSAKAAMGVALPNLILSHLDFGKMGVADFDAKLQSPNIIARLTNHGTTFAIPKVQALEIICAELLPETLIYQNRISTPFPGLIIEQGMEFELVCTKRPFFSAKEIEAIKAGKKFLWVYGYVSYEDFLYDAHERRFCNRLYTTSTGYVFAEDPDTPKIYIESN